jgi:hypothetical protein
MKVPFVFRAVAVGMMLMLSHRQHEVTGETVEVDVNGHVSEEKEPPRCPWAVYEKTKMKLTRQTFDTFPVAGVNLATYWPDEGIKKEESTEEPFELWDSLSLADLITGDEGWWELIRYRQLLQRPVNRFYYDKVALKRWLPTIGIATPRPFAIQYASELTESGQVEDETKAILSLIPNEADYAAKPSHMSLSDGSCLVSYDAANNITRFSRNATAVTKEEKFDPELMAQYLATHLHKHATDWESWTLQNVKPGIIIEERFSSVHHPDCPPPEFKVFVIWGRVWMATLDFVVGGRKWNAGLLHRNGTMVAGTVGEDNHHYKENGIFRGWLLDWLDYSRVVEIAERLGAHKDLLRVDIFVGVPASSSAKTPEERLAAVQYAVSELSFHPTSVFDDHEVIDEGARLWIAGYKMGNYRVVPNAEVPKVFVETGQLPLEALSSA